MDPAQRRDIDRQLKRAIDADILDQLYGGAPVSTTPNTTLPVDSAERKRVPLYSGPLRMFPAALAEVAKVVQVGNDKHCPGGPLQHVRWKSTDHADCIIRHLVDLSEDYGHGVGRDENGIPQIAYLAWRALALAQEWAEQNLGAPLAPAALTKEAADDAPLPTLTNSPGAAASFAARLADAHGHDALALCREWAEQNLGAPLAPAELTKEAADDAPFPTLTNSPGAAASFAAQRADAHAHDGGLFRRLECED